MTLPVVLAIAGSIALLVGLFGGGVKAKEIEVPKISALPRISSSLVGILLIGVAIWLSLPPSDKTLQLSTETVSPEISMSTRINPTFELTQEATLTSIPTFTDTPRPTNFPIAQSPTFSVPLGPTLQPITSGFLSSINAKVANLRFFESGKDVIPQDQRIYRDYFDQATTRYVCWELNLRFLHPGQRYDFIIHAIYYRSDGYIFAEQDLDAYVLPAWTDSYHAIGRGWENAGEWEKDTYTVVLYIDNTEIARASFTIQ